MYTTIEAIVEDEHPLTLRRLYYRLIGAGKIGKLETEYDNVGNMLIYLRECGRIPWEWVMQSKLDPARYAKTLRRERRERKQLRDWIATYGG